MYIHTYMHMHIMHCTSITAVPPHLPKPKKKERLAHLFQLRLALNLGQLPRLQLSLHGVGLLRTSNVAEDGGEDRGKWEISMDFYRFLMKFYRFLMNFYGISMGFYGFLWDFYRFLWDFHWILKVSMRPPWVVHWVFDMNFIEFH